MQGSRCEDGTKLQRCLGDPSSVVLGRRCPFGLGSVVDPVSNERIQFDLTVKLVCEDPGARLGWAMMMGAGQDRHTGRTRRPGAYGGRGQVPNEKQNKVTIEETVSALPPCS